MTEDGILSIVRRGTTYHVRYASYDPHGMDSLPYVCPDEGTLLALLRHCGMEPWYMQQASVDLRKGGFAALPMACLAAQRQTSFRHAPTAGMQTP